MLLKKQLNSINLDGKSACVIAGNPLAFLVNWKYTGA
jgi:hypothetical protein